MFAPPSGAVAFGVAIPISGLLNKVTPEVLQELSTERWRKEHAEEWEQLQQASMDRQTQEIIEQRGKRPQVGEVSLEDFLGTT
jgi:hypothetical protein